MLLDNFWKDSFFTHFCRQFREICLSYHYSRNYSFKKSAHSARQLLSIALFSLCTQFGADSVTLITMKSFQN
jgi:hypothetical protein